MTDLNIEGSVNLADTLISWTPTSNVIQILPLFNLCTTHLSTVDFVSSLLLSSARVCSVALSKSWTF